MFLSKQSRVAAWAQKVLGEREAMNFKERSLRVAEEAIELAQACGVDRETLYRLVDYVMRRPVGAAKSEIAGVMVTLYAAAHALRIDADTEFGNELHRIHLPEVIERIQHRNIEKREQITPNVMDASNAPMCHCGLPSTRENGWCGTCHPIPMAPIKTWVK